MCSSHFLPAQSIKSESLSWPHVTFLFSLISLPWPPSHMSEPCWPPYMQSVHSWFHAFAHAVPSTRVPFPLSLGLTGPWHLSLLLQSPRSTSPQHLVCPSLKTLSTQYCNWLFRYLHIFPLKLWAPVTVPGALGPQDRAWRLVGSALQNHLRCLEIQHLTQCWSS